MKVINYKFICPKCNKNIELTILAKDYIKDSYRCDKCGEILKRNIYDCCTNFGGNKDFCGKLGSK